MTMDSNQQKTGFKAGVSNSNCSEGQMKTYKVNRWPHYDADTMAVPEPY